MHRRPGSPPAQRRFPAPLANGRATPRAFIDAALRRDAREAAGDARVVVCVAVFRVELSHSGPLMPGKPSTLPAPATSSNGRARLRDKYTPPEHARSPVSSPEAKRKILAAVTARSHVYNDDDPWFSCPQAVVSDDPTPGSGCANETRVNGPCDGGRDRFVATVVGALLPCRATTRTTQRLSPKPDLC